MVPRKAGDQVNVIRQIVLGAPPFQGYGFKNGISNDFSILWKR